MTGAEVLMSKFVCDMAVMLDENAALKRALEEKDKRIAELDAALLEAAAQRKKPSVILRAAGRDASQDYQQGVLPGNSQFQETSRLILRSDVDSAEPAVLENGHDG